MNYADRDLEDYRITNMQRWGYPTCPKEEELEVRDAPIGKMIEWIASLVDGNEYDRQIAKDFITEVWVSSKDDTVGGLAMDICEEYEDKFLDWWEEN